MSHRGRFNSIFPIIRKIGFAMGPFLTGIYIKYVSVRAVWPVTFTLSLLAALLMYKLYADEKKDTCSDIETLQR
jgi:MFS family permease